MICDFTMITYWLEFLLCSFAFLIFVFWLFYKWRAERSMPSDIYVLFVLLFFARAYSVYLGIQARELKEIGVAYHNYMDSFFWDTRNIPELIVLSTIVMRKTKKILIHFMFPGRNRRRNDKDNL